MAGQYHKLERTENVERNVVFGLLNKTLALVLPFIVRTVLIYRFGAEYLGLNSVFSSVLQVLSLAELGFGAALTYSMYEPIAKNDHKLICAYLNTYRKVYFMVGCIILVGGLIAMPFLPHLVHDAVIPGDLNIYLWFSAFLADVVISYWLYAFKMSIPIAFQRDDLLSKVDMGIMTIRSILQLILLMTSTNFYLYLLAFPVTTILRNFWISAMVDKRFPEYKPEGKISTEQNADLRQRVRGLLVNKICITSRNGIDSVCISAFLGLTIAGIYHSYFYVLNALVAISQILMTAMTPGVGNSLVIEPREKNYADMRRFNFMYMIIAGWASICMLCLYQPFVRVWIGEKLMLSNPAVIALCLYFYMLKMGDMRWVYTEAAGLWWECRHLMVIETAANIILNIVLVKLWGVVGIIVATIISLLFINFFGSTRIVFNHYFKNGKLFEFFADHLRYFVVTLIITVVTYAACRGAGTLVSGGKWAQFLIRIPISAILPIPLYYLLYCRTNEFKEAFAWAKTKIPKRFIRSSRSSS